MKKFLPNTIKNPQVYTESLRQTRDKQSRSGFTLIELMVVISIVAILSVIGIVIFTGAQKNARDAKRRSDINAVATALEASKPSGGNYPVLTNSMFAQQGGIPGDPSTNRVYCANSTAGAQPADPLTDWVGTCPASSGTLGTTNPPTGSAWKICAWLESSATPYCRVSSQ